MLIETCLKLSICNKNNIYEKNYLFLNLLNVKIWVHQNLDSLHRIPTLLGRQKSRIVHVRKVLEKVRVDFSYHLCEFNFT